jgi:hypothetical protein
MTVQCQLLIDGSMTAVDGTFLYVPRVGELVFIDVNGSPDMFHVKHVTHFARGAMADSPDPFIQLTVSRRP